MYSIADASTTIYNSVMNNNDIYSHKSIVVAGDNDSGKTSLLKDLLSKVKDEDNKYFYFIDATNRIVYGSEFKNYESGIRYADFTPLEILKERSSLTYLSKEDIFPQANKGSFVTYSELRGNVDKYEQLLNKFFDCKIELVTELNEESIISGNEILSINGIKMNSLSSSKAAIIRLIMEIEYAKTCGCKMVIVDEFDNSLDPDNQVKLISQFQANYPELRFLFVIHDYALIVQLSDIDALIYNPKTASFEIHFIDCDDITEIGEVERIRAKYIGKRDPTEIFLSDCVTEFLRKGKLSEKSRCNVFEIERNKLNMKNRILYDYIMEHQNHETTYKNQI